MSWLAYQLDSAVLAFHDEWEAERDRAYGQGGRGSEQRVSEAFRRFMAGDHLGTNWVAEAKRASQRAREDYAKRRAERPDEAWEIV